MLTYLSFLTWIFIDSLYFKNDRSEPIPAAGDESSFLFDPWHISAGGHCQYVVTDIGPGPWTALGEFFGHCPGFDDKFLALFEHLAGATVLIFVL